SSEPLSTWLQARSAHPVAVMLTPSPQVLRKGKSSAKASPPRRQVLCEGTLWVGLKRSARRKACHPDGLLRCIALADCPWGIAKVADDGRISRGRARPWREAAPAPRFRDERGALAAAGNPAARAVAGSGRVGGARRRSPGVLPVELPWAPGGARASAG